MLQFVIFVHKNSKSKLFLGEVTIVIVCVCVCLSVTTLAGATRALRAQLRYQKKALDTRIKLTVGIQLKVLNSKVMTVCSSTQKPLWALLAETRHQQATITSPRLLAGQALLLALLLPLTKLHKLSWRGHCVL